MKTDTELMFDAIATYGIIDKEMEYDAEYLNIFDAREDFTVENIKRIVYPSCKFIEMLDEEIFQDLCLDQVKGLVILKDGYNESIIAIDEEIDNDNLYCFIDENLLVQRLSKLEKKERVENALILVLFLLCIAFLFQLI